MKSYYDINLACRDGVLMGLLYCEPGAKTRASNISVRSISHSWLLVELKALATFPSFAFLLQMLWTSVFGGKKAMSGEASEEAEDLIFLKELVETKKIRPVIDDIYSLEQIADAHSYVETGHKKGNVVITVSHDDA